MGARAKRRRGRPNKPPRTVSGTVPAHRAPKPDGREETPVTAWSDDLEISILGPLEEFPLDEVGARQTVPVEVPLVRDHARASCIPIDAILRQLPPANDASSGSPSPRDTLPVQIVPTRRAIAHDPRNTTLPVAPRPELLAACRPEPVRRGMRPRVASRIVAAVAFALVSTAAFVAANRHRATRAPARAATSMSSSGH
jgi:hypothetical protein